MAPIPTKQPPPNIPLLQQLIRIGVRPRTALSKAHHPAEAKALLKKFAVKKLTTKRSGKQPTRVPGPSTIQ